MDILPLLQSLCAAVVMAVMVSVMATPLHPMLRTILRPTFLQTARRGLGAVTAVQGLRSPLLSTLVAASSATVGWGYYLTGLPVLLWLVDAELGIQSVWLMFVATWLGNGLKDLLSAPRPLEIASDADRAELARCVQSLDVTHSKEYGAPSTHTMNSLAMNLYLLLALQERRALSIHRMLMCTLLVCLWSAWMAFGRVYCVMHTPGDTYLGYALGLCLAVAWSAWGEALMAFARDSVWAPACGLGIAVAVSLLYPTPLTKHTPCHEQNTSFAGVAYGGLLGLQLSNAQCMAKTTWSSFDVVALASPQGLMGTCARLTVLASTLAVSLKCSRPIIRPFLRVCMSSAPAWLRSSWQPPLHCSTAPPKVRLLPSGQPADIESAARFVSYTMVGVASVWVPYCLLCDIPWT